MRQKSRFLRKISTDGRITSYNVCYTKLLRGDFYKAVEMYKSALNYNSKFFNAVNGLAHAYYGLDEFDESLKYVLQAEKLDSKNTDLMNLKGRIYLNKGDFKKAKEIFVV